MEKINLYINKVLHLFELMKVKEQQNVVYITFDDGPEGEITDYVLDLLKSYEAKATFFCKGDNALMNPQQFKRIIAEGHSIGNHTFSHINSFKTPAKKYCEDVERANDVLHTHLFRPPWGSLTLKAFLKLYGKYKIVYWNSLSGDTDMGNFNLERSFASLTARTRKGDIILFHSCNLHANKTKQILPLYLKWLTENGYTCKKLK